MDRWIIGIFCTLLSLLGLFQAMYAVDDGMFEFGILLFLFGPFLIWWITRKPAEGKG
jgi:hypothetical protein